MGKSVKISWIAFVIVTNVGCTSTLSAQYLLPIDSLSKQLALAPQDSIKIKLLFEIGREYWFSRNFQDAVHYLRRSVSLGERSHYFKYQADAYNLLSNVFLKTEALDSAFSYLQKAQELKNEKFMPLIYETYSKVYFQLGDYRSSLDFAIKSANGYENDPDPIFNLQTVFAYLMVGDILNKLGRDEDAFQYFQRSYQKARTASKNWYIKSPIQKIAEYHFSRGEFGKARHLYDTIIAIDKDAPSFEPTMFSYEGLGNIAMKEKKYEKAIAYYKLALGYALQKQLSINVEQFYTKAGSAFLAHHQYDSSLKYLQSAILLSTKSKNYLNLSRAHRLMASLHQENERFREALALFQLHKTYDDSILSVEKVRSINNLEVLYRTHHHENEILRLQKVELDKDFAIKKRNIYIAIGIGLVAGMGVILTLLARTYRHKQRLQAEKVKKLERQHRVASLQSMINGQETERLRIARDLHDGLGGLFSTVKMYFSTLEHEHVLLRSNDIFKKSYSLVDSASLEIRRIAHNMMPEVLMKMGLINAIKDMVNHTNAGQQLRVSLEMHSMTHRLNTHTEIMLFRIIQELLNNIVRHARATEALIQFIRDENRLSVVVEDNGCGFNAHETDEQNHTGLATVRSRVEYLNGTLNIDSQENIGTTVMIDFIIVDSRPNGSAEIKPQKTHDPYPDR